MFRPRHRHPGPVGASAEGFHQVPHKCRACGWGGELGVRGEAFAVQMSQYVGGEMAAEKAASALASRLVGPDARQSAELSCCPRCGRRDELAVDTLKRRAAWRSAAALGALVLLRLCAGPLPWSVYPGALAIAGLLGVYTFHARLHRADRAVLFSKEAEPPQ